MLLKSDWVRLALSCFLMMQAGMSDASLGALLVSLHRHYSLSYSTVSLIFLVNIAGWSIATPSVPFLLHHLGMRTTLILAALLHMLASLIMLFAAPFGAVIAALLLFGIGAGVIDAALSTYVARLGSERLISVLYAFISVGGLISPLIIGTMLGGSAAWTHYYFVPIGMATASLVPVWCLFGDYKEADKGQEGEDKECLSVGDRYKKSLSSWTIILGGLLTSLGLGTTELLAGWIVSYMASIRHGHEAMMRYVLSGFWAGHALGRFLLPFLPVSFRHSVPLFLVLIIGLLTSVQFVPNLYGNAVAVAFTGFFLGPVTPAVLSIVSSYVPSSLLSMTVSILTSFGLVVSVLAPVLMGVASNAGGLHYLPAALMGMGLLMLALWGLAEVGWRRKDFARDELCKHQRV